MAPPGLISAALEWLGASATIGWLYPLILLILRHNIVMRGKGS